MNAVKSEDIFSCMHMRKHLPEREMFRRLWIISDNFILFEPDVEHFY